MTSARWLAPLLAIASPVAAEAPVATPSLAPWHGSWTGEGTAFGQPATATLAIAPAETGATRLAYRLTIAGAPVYAAEALYHADAGGRLHGTWTDATGRARAVRGRVAASEWIANWGGADFEIGRSTYVLETGGALVVIDSVLDDDGGWCVFTMLRYRRSNG